MAFIALEVALELIEAVKPLVPLIRRTDRDLADQIRRAASSAALNLGEGQPSDPGNQRARFHTAAGSANETRVALRVALAWGYLAEPQAATALRIADRLVGMLWRLSRGP